MAVRKVIREYCVKTRMASCFCSSCQISKYEECHVYRTYPALVPALMEGEVEKTVIMDTGVAPAVVDQPQETTFPPPKGGMHGVESYWDPVARERSGFCS